MLSHRTFLYDPQAGGLHKTLMRGKSSVIKKDPRSDNLGDPVDSYYPSFLFKEIIMMIFVFILVAIVLAVYFPVGLEDPADPTDNLYIPKPAWYFMAFYQLLKYFPGRLETIATAVLPAGGIMMLLLLPFIDKSPEKRPRKRPIAMIAMGLVALSIILLTIIGFAS